MREYTHPEVFEAIKRGEPWADPIPDPTQINWAERQAKAAIPFQVVDGRPVNPVEPHLPAGRNQLGHWGEQQCADALVIATDQGRRWVLLVERGDGHGWAIPGGTLDPGETPFEAAIRELKEETGLVLPGAVWAAGPARYVPDPRASREAWMVTTLVTTTISGRPAVKGADDARRAEWVPAGSYDELTDALDKLYGGTVFRSHVDLLREALAA